MAQAKALPFPLWMELTCAATHDLRPFKAILDQLWHCRIFGDKAYLSQEVENQLKEQQAQLFSPIKK